MTRSPRHRDGQRGAEQHGTPGPGSPGAFKECLAQSLYPDRSPFPPSSRSVFRSASVLLLNPAVRVLLRQVKMSLLQPAR